MSKSDSVKFKKSGDVYVGIVRIASITEQRDLDNLSSVILGFLDNHDEIKLVLDFRNVQYLSSAALGELISIHRTLTEKRGLLRLCHLSPQIREVFEVTRLHERFDIDPTLRDALQNFKTDDN